MKTKRKMHYGRWIALVLLLVSVLYMIRKVDQALRGSDQLVEIENFQPFSESELEAFGGVAVQDGGRVKPLETVASFTMMRFSGARSMKILVDGEEYKMSSLEWYLQTMFYPEVAMHFPTFLVDNIAALELIGLVQKIEAENEGKADEDKIIIARRDRFSYAQLAEVSEELFQKERELRAAEEAGRDLVPEEKMLLDVARNFRSYDGLLSAFYWVRSGVPIPAMNGREASVIAASDFGPLADAIMNQLDRSGGNAENVPPEVRSLAAGFFEVARTADGGPSLIVPRDVDDADVADDEAPLPEWLSAGRAMGGLINGQRLDSEWVSAELEWLEKTALAVWADDDATAEIAAFSEHVHEGAMVRNEDRKIGSERLYNKINYFLWALVAFLVAFLFAGLLWFMPNNLGGKIAKIAVWTLSVVGLILILAAIGHRVQIMERAPIGTLFDTIPFITGGAVFVVLFIEFFTRRGLFLSFAPILGILGIFLTRSFEIGDGQDTLDPLQAVLDSQFWLLVHVITIVMGYSAGLLTAMISLAYIFVRILKLDDDSPTMRRDLTRAAYGCACFTLFLTLIGTVLGGVWANDSWGRFWGWDPKENGALMITLWFLFILHARLGGYIKEWGLHIASFASTAVIVFSWWHVNMLGVGLHAYGFSDEDKMNALKTTYWFVLVVCVIATVYAAIELNQKRTAKRDAIRSKLDAEA